MTSAALPDTPGANRLRAPLYADRHNKELTQTQRERPRAGTRHLANGLRDQRTRSPLGSMAASRPSPLRQGKPSTTVNRAGAEVKHLAAVPAADADQRQAEYFLRLLAHNHRHVGERIDRYQRTIASAQASGVSDDASGIRHMMRIAEQEQQALGGLIDRLQRRFRIRL